MLPPEIRSRIYDYVFGSNLVRITSYLHAGQRSRCIGCKISRGTCDYDHTQLSPRVRGYKHDVWSQIIRTEACQHCTGSDAQRTSVLEGFSLPFLQASRQIYHEAALKPFQQAMFVFDFVDSQSKEASYGLPAFMNALVPAQVKAITHLRLLSVTPTCIRYAKLPRLEGLKHLEMQVNFSFAHFDHTSRLLEDFAASPIVRSLAKLDLRSVRFELGLDEHDYRDMTWAEIEGMALKPPTTAKAELFEGILKRMEAGLVGPRL
jgi:hypothetical protein